MAHSAARCLMARPRSPGRQPALSVLPGGRSAVLYDLEAEESVAGSVLLDPTAIGRVVEYLGPEHFYRENNGALYAAARELFRGTGRTCSEGRPTPIDVVTLAAELEARGELDRIGGRARLAMAQEQVPTAANVEHYARIVLECAARRAEVAEHRRALEAAGCTVWMPELAQAAQAEETRADPLLAGTLPIDGSGEYRYRPATDADAGCVVRLLRQGQASRVEVRWAPRVEAVFVVRDADDDAVDTLYRVRMSGQARELRASELRSGSAWDALGLLPGAGERRVRDVLFNIVRQEAAGLKGEAIVTVTRTGWHDLEGGLVYVHADGRTRPEGARIRLSGMPAATARVAAPPSSEASIEELRSVLRTIAAGAGLVSGRATGLPLLLAAAGLRSLGASVAPPLTSVVLEAGRGAGKSGASLFARGVTFGVKHPPEATAALTADTANSIEGALAREVDVPVLVDDLALQADASISTVQEAVAKLDRLWRAAANGQPVRRRMRRDLTEAPGNRVRCLPVYTCENLPPITAASALRRVLILTWERGELAARCHDCRHDGGTAPCLGAVLEDAWPALRRLGDLVIARLAELGRSAAEELLTKLDQRHYHELRRRVRDHVGAAEAAERAAPLLTGLKLAEELAGLEAGELVQPAAEAVVPHLIRQGRRIEDRGASADDVAALTGAIIRRALLERRAHVLTAHGVCDPLGVGELMGLLGVEPQELGYREVRGGEGPAYGDGAGVPLYAWPEPAGLAVRGEGLFHLLTATKDPRFAGLTSRRLVDVLFERGALLPSHQAGKAAAWRLPIGACPPSCPSAGPGCKNHKPRVVVVRRELVFPAEDDPSRAHAPTHERPPGDPGAFGDPGDPTGASELDRPGLGGPQLGSPASDLGTPASPASAAPPNSPGPQGPQRSEQARSGEAPYSCPACGDPQGQGYEPLGDGRRRCLACRDEWGPDESPPMAPTRAPASSPRPPSPQGPRAGVVGAEGVWLPGGEELFAAELQGAALFELLEVARERGLRQLWIHAEALELLGLPAELAEGARMADLPPFQETAAAGWRLEGFASAPGWLTAYPLGSAPDDRSGWLEVYVPAYAGHLSTLARAATARELLAALELLDRRVGLRFHRSPGTYLMSLARRAHRGPRAVELGERAPLPAELEKSNALPDGERILGGLYRPAEAERALPFVRAFDANAMYLAVLIGLELGYGPLCEVEAGQLAGALRTIVRRPGYYRATVTAPSGLPFPPPFAVDGKERWYSHVGLELLRDLGCEVEFRRAVAWERHTRYLRPVGERLVPAREALMVAADAAEPGAVAALDTLKATYTRGLGRFKHERQGWGLQRPEWDHAVRAKAYANLYRRLYDVAARTGHRPLLVTTDTFAFACSEPEPAATAEALGLELSAQGGKFKPAGRLTMARFLELAERGRGGGPQARKAITDQLREARWRGEL
jgi:DnaB-like helicase N terminal domain